jgi:AGZA family xanthine/uracil permease-like MFS transporter
MRTSKVTTYVESASGVEAGGRKGLTSVVVAAFFLLAIFISPIASVIRGMQHLRLL